MARSIWSGFLSFGLVNVPVKLYSAVQPKEIRFHLLHDADGMRIQQRRVCPEDGQEVPSEHLVRGYEVSPRRFVVVTDDELAALDPKHTRTIEIQEFVELARIDSMFYEASYYLAPDKGGANAYALLLEAMRRSGRAAVARFVLRTREAIAVVRPRGGALLLSTLRYADELVAETAVPELPVARRDLDARELAMAEQLIDSLAEEFQPAKYRDEYRARVLELVERKAEGKEVVVQPVREERARVIDLMSALEASLAEAKKRRAAEEGNGAASSRRNRSKRTGT